MADFQICISLPLNYFKKFIHSDTDVIVVKTSELDIVWKKRINKELKAL